MVGESRKREVGCRYQGLLGREGGDVNIFLSDHLRAAESGRWRLVVRCSSGVWTWTIGQLIASVRGREEIL